MIAPLDAIEKAINAAAGAQALDDLARLVWRGHSENAIDEDDAQRLSEQIASRRPQCIQIDGPLYGFARSIMGSITSISSLETGGKPRGNVCTELSISERARRLVPQGFQADRRDNASRSPSCSVIGNESFSHPERGGAKPITAPPGPRSLSSSVADRGRTRSKSKRPLKRGPPGSTRLTWPQVKEIDDFAHIARSAGVPLNRMVTIRAPIGVSDADGKQSIRQIVSHIRQDFEQRNGLLLIGVVIYEKHPLLHAHILLHAPRGNGSLIAKRHEGKGGTVHVRPADEQAVEYVTKQRQRLSPDYEDVIKRRWISSKGGQIEGPRYTYTTAAKALLARCHAPPQDEQSRYQAANLPLLLTVPPSPPTTNVVQLALFDDLPEQRDGADIPDVIRAIRLQAGITQTDLAQRMGIRQPHLANVERRHDRLSRATRRAARYHLERLAA